MEERILYPWYQTFPIFHEIGNKKLNDIIETDSAAKTLLILGGANGSGKSTMAKEFLQSYSLDFLNADEIAHSFDSYHSSRKIQLLAGREYFKQRKRLFQQNRSFIIETTLSGHDITKTMREAKQQA